MEIVVFVVLCKSYHDAVLGTVDFIRVEKVFLLDDNSFGWFSYSWDTAEVSNVSIFERVTNRRTVNETRPV